MPPRPSMHIVFVTLQLVLLVVALPLLFVSVRTSRGHRTSHAGFTAVAALLALLAGVAMMLSLSAFAGDEPMDPALVLVPPIMTIIGCAWVIRRGVASQSGAAAARHRDATATPPARQR
ncbi:MAG: hypothetical protein ABI696_01855 [Rubrivivax sp.]